MRLGKDMTSNRPNIFWIVTDSARNFSTGGLDDRDRPSFYDTLSDDFTEFEQAMTSAPSSVMSGSCMLTGMNSYFIGRNYDDFRYEKGAFPNLADILAVNGYKKGGIFVAREMREKIAPFIGHVGKEFWPKNTSHSQVMWKNEIANDILDKFLSDRSDRDPLFMMIWNNIRHDPDISSKLSDLLQIIKKHVYYHNSIIIFCADHGYPHPRRGFTPEYLERVGLTHDLMLGDDNILVPMFIKAPGSIPKKISTQVGTVDLFPTILDYSCLGEYDGKNEYPQHGTSLKNLLNGWADAKYLRERSLRCDCRFFGQKQRRTAIRQNNFKYIYSHDDGSEEFFDVKYDPSEDVNLIKFKNYSDKIEELRSAFTLQENEANMFQQEYLAKKFLKSIHINLKNKVVLFSTLETQMNDCILKAIDHDTKLALHSFFCVPDNNQPHILEKYVCENINVLKSSDVSVILLKPSSDATKSHIEKILFNNGINLDGVYDINLSKSPKIKWGVIRIFKALYSRRTLIRNEPSLLLTYVKEYVLRRLKRWVNH